MRGSGDCAGGAFLTGDPLAGRLFAERLFAGRFGLLFMLRLYFVSQTMKNGLSGELSMRNRAML